MGGHHVEGQVASLLEVLGGFCHYRLKDGGRDVRVMGVDGIEAARILPLIGLAVTGWLNKFFAMYVS